MIPVRIGALLPLLAVVTCQPEGVSRASYAAAKPGSVWGIPSAATAEQPGARPDSLQERLGRAREQVRNGQFQEAIPLLKQLLAEDSDCAEAHMLLGMAFRSLASPEFIGEAQAELRQALMLDPRLHWARFALGRIYLDLGRHDRAREELERGLQGLPDQPLFLSFLAEAHRLLGEPQRSVELSAKALKRSPNLAVARYHQALAWRDLDQPEKAVRELEAGLLGEPVLPEMLRTLGELYLRTGKRGQAVRMLEKAVALDPSNAEGHLELARAHLQGHEPDQALRQLEHAFPEGTPMLSSPYFQNLEADVYFVLGEANAAKGLEEAALQAYLRVVEIRPDHREAHRRLARLYGSRGDTGRSSEHARRAAELKRTSMRN